jgi:ribosome-binding protein aMBF1 (putative translation factor)
MSIYQDWTNVDIGYKSNLKNKLSNTFNKKKNDVYDGTPPTITYWNKDLIIALQQLRTANGYNQKDLSNKLNLPSSMINDIEANKCPYNPTLYKKIFRFLGGDPSTLNFPKVK